jgi:hypothetical protein
LFIIILSPPLGMQLWLWRVIRLHTDDQRIRTDKRQRVGPN